MFFGRVCICEAKILLFAPLRVRMNRRFTYLTHYTAVSRTGQPAYESTTCVLHFRGTRNGLNEVSRHLERAVQREQSMTTCVLCSHLNSNKSNDDPRQIRSSPLPHYSGREEASRVHPYVIMHSDLLPSVSDTTPRYGLCILCTCTITCTPTC